MVTPAARKPIARYLIDAFKRSERVVCKLAGVSRSGFRYCQKDMADDSVRSSLNELASRYPRYAYLILMSYSKVKAWL